MCNQSAFGGMLQDLVALNSIVLRPELLDAEIERRCKQAWEQAPCPECGETAIQSGADSPRVWCTNCRYTFTYTRNTPFHGRTLTPGEFIIAFVLYADTLLSIHQIAQLFDAVYDTVHTTIREGEAAFERGFSLVWQRIQHAALAAPGQSRHSLNPDCRTEMNTKNSQPCSINIHIKSVCTVIQLIYCAIGA